MKNICIGVILLFSCEFVYAQSDEETQAIDDLNRQLDKSVVEKEIPILEKHYGDDFVFTHSDGPVDSKESWIKSIIHAHYLSREHDSTKVELHGDIAIVTGKLSVEQKAKHGQQPAFAVKYVRVFARRNDIWQLICHRSVTEMEL
jgi:ketosteroid isomerase-like protein